MRIKSPHRLPILTRGGQFVSFRLNAKQLRKPTSARRGAGGSVKRPASRALAQLASHLTAGPKEKSDDEEDDDDDSEDDDDDDGEAAAEAEAARKMRKKEKKRRKSSASKKSKKKKN